jgi:hypothetical protein
MKWFRSNIKQGARLALLALVVQFALSFGHFHAVAAQTAPELHSAQQRQPASDPDRHPGDACAICTVVALANTALLATPPVLALPQAVQPNCLATDVAFIHLKAARGAFQPRAPPLS